MIKTIIYVILSILSFLYSLIVLRAKSGTYSFAIWIGATLFFAFLAFMAWHDRWANIPSICHKVFHGIVIMALIVFAITQGCILSQFFAKGEPNSDYIVVLGAQMRDWGPSIIFK
ncbi:MAG: YdcF family protein, partial [Lachnospiraceae bacterium]|nr:YdcF family protein [Lachnospiraceae bacterium]